MANAAAEQGGQASTFEPAPATEVLMEDMAEYVEKHDINNMLKEYIRRVVLEKPDDPISFLINEIETNPFQPNPIQHPPDHRSEVEQNKHLDRRTRAEKTSQLQDLFRRVNRLDAEYVSRAELVVAMRQQERYMVEFFPRHHRDLPAWFETATAEKYNQAQFVSEAMECLDGPGNAVPV